MCSFQSRCAALFHALRLDEQPMGAAYTDTRPVSGFTPEKQIPLTQENHGEDENTKFSCSMSRIRLARRKKTAAFFSREHYGCEGAAYYYGFAPFRRNSAEYMSEIEKYIDTSDMAETFSKQLDPPAAKHQYLVIRPLDQFTDIPPELVIFFVRSEVLCGLKSLALFVTNDMDVIQTPGFGPGCSSIISWPMKYLARNQQKAVIGTMDPSCRPYMKPDELSFTVPFAMFEKMVTRWDESFLTTHDWNLVQRRIIKLNSIEK